MGPFNNRQTAYIRAIAGKSNHKSFIVSNDNRRISGFTALDTAPQNFDNTVLSNKGLTMFQWCLNDIPRGLDSRQANIARNINSWVPNFTHYGFGGLKELGLLKCPIDVNAGGLVPDHDHAETNGPRTGDAGEHAHFGSVTSTQLRIGTQAFLESTHMTLRFTMPDRVPQGTEANHAQSMHTPHYEWRLIVYRNKRQTYRNPDNNLGALRDGVSFANPGYDLFMGQAGRCRGPLGWRTHRKFDEHLTVDSENIEDDNTSDESCAYAGKWWNGTSWQDGIIDDLTPPGEDLMTADDYLTFRLNRNDYVIHTDERFFLGQQFGKSHYEKTLHFDWKDFVDTIREDLIESPTLDGKNYQWNILLIGTANGTDAAELDCCIRATTSLTSGE